MATNVVVPTVGESIREVQIVQWLKRPGQWVAKDEALVEIDTEKATVQIPSPASGVVSQIAAGDGQFAEVGQVIGSIDESAPPPAAAPAAQESPPPAAATPAPSSPAPPESQAAAPGKNGGGAPGPRVMPAARHALAEHGLSAEVVQATGPGGRLLKEDVERHAAQPANPPPAPVPASPPRSATAAPAPAAPAADRQEEIVPMSMIRRAIAQRLVDAQQQAALLTTFNEIDMSAVVELRKKYRDTFHDRYGVKLGFMSFFAKALVEALKRFPALNAEIRDKHIAYRNYYDIGVAIGGGKGLVVPVLRDVQRMSFAEIERAIDDFGRRAQKNQLSPEELEGGTFTITNGGIYGSMLSTPIVNPPQSGILGLHAIQDRPVAREGQVVIRPMMYVALTYDHRIVDGREAVTFLRTVKEIIEDPARLMLEI